MASQGASERSPAKAATKAEELPVEQEAKLRDRLVRRIRAKPVATAAVAVAMGAALGGVFFSRLGRFVFVAAVGYVANGLWHRDARIDIANVVEELLGRPGRGAPARARDDAREAERPR
jgi:hypothetical protein